MKIMIVGAGKTGAFIAQDLCREGHDITIVDIQPGRLRALSGSLDVICAEGSGTDLDLLQQAGIAGTDMFIAATGSDERNLLCCLSARRLGAGHTVARLRDRSYLNQTSMLQDDIGLYLAVSPDLESASEIARILEFPSAVQVETFAGGRMELVEYRIPAESALHGVALNSLLQRFHAHVLICAIERGQQVIIPKGDFVLRSGDAINVVADRNALRTFFKATGAYKKAARSVLILGGSRIAELLAMQLAGAGIQTTILEMDEARARELGGRLPKTHIICADGSRPEVLREEGLWTADAFVALSGNDEQNLIISMFAQKCGVGKVIAKVNEENLISMFADSGLDCFINPKRLAANRIVAGARALVRSGSSVEALYRLVNGRVEALEFLITDNSACVGIPLRELPIRQDVLVAAVLRKNQYRIADGSTVIRPGDRVVLVTTGNGLFELDAILQR